MQKINFQNLPSTTTPINATNLNAIQTNVEDVFNGSETMGNIVVGSIRTKNMFDKNSFLNANGGVGSYSTLDTGIRAITGTTGANQWLNFKLPNSLLGKTCTLSFKATPSSTNTPMVRIYYGSATNMTNTNANFDLYGSGNKSITNTFLSSFPSGTDGIYMLIYCNRDGSGFSSGAYIDYTNLQLEEGSSITGYTPYQELDNQEIYSLGEIKIGTWLGKPLYRKVVSATTPSSTGTGTNIYNISSLNIDRLVKLEYNLKDTYNEIVTGAQQIGLFTRVNGTDRQIACTVNNATYVSKAIYIIVEYTKTTD